MLFRFCWFALPKVIWLKGDPGVSMYNPWWFYWPRDSGLNDLHQAGDATSEPSVGTETLTPPEQRIPQVNRLRKVKTHTESDSKPCKEIPRVVVIALLRCCLLKKSWQRCGCSLIACLNKGLESGAAMSCQGWKETRRKKARLLCKPCQHQHFLSVLQLKWK